MTRWSLNSTRLCPPVVGLFKTFMSNENGQRGCKQDVTSLRETYACRLVSVGSELTACSDILRWNTSKLTLAIHLPRGNVSSHRALNPFCGRHVVFEDLPRNNYSANDVRQWHSCEEMIIECFWFVNTFLKQSGWVRHVVRVARVRWTILHLLQCIRFAFFSKTRARTQSNSTRQEAPTPLIDKEKGNKRLNRGDKHSNDAPRSARHYPASARAAHCLGDTQWTRWLGRG